MQTHHLRYSDFCIIVILKILGVKSMCKLGEYLSKVEIEELNEQSGGLPYFDEFSPVIKHFPLNINIHGGLLQKLLVVYAKYGKSGWIKCIVCVFGSVSCKRRLIRYYSEGYSSLVEELSFVADELLDKVKEINRAIRFIEES